MIVSEEMMGACSTRLIASKGKG
ncbi:Protein of unknown function [Pyronema omphalodes CBS 100304]|uniref:Uncharacterized protein n=1 Tax=Pyronema omphalodes (strain CBS 100304) TaxID=1076935 RepID=U4LJU9_PYROM|nr:Protein of unknown function [Pyronema omphalodes CBS 100304]